MENSIIRNKARKGAALRKGEDFQNMAEVSVLKLRRLLLAKR